METTPKPNPTIMNISRPPGGTQYLVKVPTDKVKRGYDLVTVICHANGAVSTKSANCLAVTQERAGKFVRKYLDSDLMTRETMRGTL